MLDCFYWRQDSLLILDASGNGIGGEDVEPLLSLYRLEVLNFADNAVEDMAQVLALEQLERSNSCYRSTNMDVSVDDQIYALSRICATSADMTKTAQPATANDAARTLRSMCTVGEGCFSHEIG